MAKRTRRPIPRPSASGAASDAAAQGTSESPAGTEGAASSSGRPTTSRARSTTRPARRTRSAPTQSPLERYRTLIFGAVVVLVVVIIGYVAFGQSNVPQGTYAAVGPQYACDSLLTPGPVESVTPTPVVTPSPSPSPTPSGQASPTASASPDASASPVASSTPVPPPTPRLGFTTTVLGRGHVLNPNESIEYGFCPPTSGDHYNVAGRGPIRGAVYPTTDQQPPGGWVHNLEHGWVVALYRCSGPDDCPTDADMVQLQAFFDQAPNSANPGCGKEVLVARFDAMDTPFAMVSWGRALLMDKFDLDTALTFARQWMDAASTPEMTTC